jgi:hypothetical protein
VISSDIDSWDLERRSDGAVLVRVHSRDRGDGAPLPDAVFAFRAGDPQFTYWEQQWRLKQQGS